MIRRLFSWRTLRRTLVGLAVMATLIAIFYAEENWRGKRAWDNCKRELEAKGVVLDWYALIPPAVPDDQNALKAPRMQEWFVGRGTTELSKRLINAVPGDITKLSIAEATMFLARTDGLEADFDLIREALKRPYARMEGDYSHPFAMPIPNFVTSRAVAQMLAKRTQCHLVLGRPEEALHDLTLIRNFCRFLEGAPAGKPITLVAAMVNVAITGLYVDTVADGMKLQAWQEPQLAAIQSQLQQINLLPIVAESFQDERAAVSYTLEKAAAALLANQMPGLKGAPINLWNRLNEPLFLFLTFAPRGWVFQNIVTDVAYLQLVAEAYDLKNNLVLPGKTEEANRMIGSFKRSGFSPYSFLASWALPNYLRATQTLARNQTKANQAFVVCALERYRRANGHYPETLDALVPQFADRLPHDIIGGQPLKYRRTDDPPSQSSGAASGKFLLYSIGWNEKDDGGIVARNQDGKEDWEQDDWVWKNF